MNVVPIGVAREDPHRCGGRKASGATRLKAEGRAVQVALDGFVDDVTLRQRDVAVAALVLDREDPVPRGAR